MRDYEMVMVVSPEQGEEGFAAALDRVTQLIQEKGGEVRAVDRWGKRRLAYPIKRFNEGFYAVMQFGLDPEAVRGLEGNLELAEDIIRYLVVRLEPVK